MLGAVTLSNVHLDPALFYRRFVPLEDDGGRNPCSYKTLDEGEYLGTFLFEGTDE
ncbi:hypothetical protein LCGC14_1211400 [marine sediment metagenome]|uniref:Uncharacterized protein n=1 Tax=marine sediment metagenome TaxID=412755 RepID=A0A0F9NW83_9ZZZZ